MTDPPYGMSYQSHHRKVKHGKIANDDSLEWLPFFAEHAFRIAKMDTAHYVFCSWHNIDVFKQEFAKHFSVKNILVWVKNNHGAGDLSGDYAPKHELILFLTKGRPLRNQGQPRISNVLEYAKTNNNLHPTQKPIDLCETLLNQFAPESGLVFDPFAGSGSSLLAARNTCRDYLGLELSPHYCETITERLYSDH